MKNNQSSFYYEGDQRVEEGDCYYRFEIKKELLEKYMPSKRLNVVNTIKSTRTERRAA